MEESEKKSVQVTTYLPKEVLEQLKKWMDDNYQRSVSQAVSLIVEHFLKKDGRPLGDTDLAPRVAALESANLPPRLEQLEIQMQQLREALIAAGARSLATCSELQTSRDETANKAVLKPHSLQIKGVSKPQYLQMKPQSLQTNHISCK